jgi:hypothetical protein
MIDIDIMANKKKLYSNMIGKYTSLWYLLELLYIPFFAVEVVFDTETSGCTRGKGLQMVQQRPKCATFEEAMRMPKASQVRSGLEAE